MSVYIEKKRLKLRVLTPVHISDGSQGELIPTEYIITDKGQLHKIDLAELVRQIPDDKLGRLNTLIEAEDIIRIRNFIKLLWKEDQDLFKDAIEYSMQAGDLLEYYENLENENPESQFMLTPFIRSSQRIFIPGSSLKGAIRTAFINELAQNRVCHELNAKYINKKAQMLEADILHYSYQDRKTGKWKSKATKDPFKTVKTGDVSVPSGNSIIKKIEIVRKTKVGKFDATGMEEMKIFAEVIKRDVEVDTEITLDKRFFSIPGKIGREISLEQLAGSCKAFYERVLKHERDNFFDSFDSEVGNSRIAKLYDDFLKLNEDPNCFLLRIGKHSGRNSLSFNLINKKGEEPKSRKLIIEGNEYWPLGWASVTRAT